MKWIRWDGDCCFDWRHTAPDSPDDENYKSFTDEGFIDCEKDANWREIESGVLDTETGKLRITLKPVVKKEQVANVEIRFPANGDHDSLAVYGFMQDGSFGRTVAKRDSKLWGEFYDAKHEYGNVYAAEQVKKQQEAANGG